jgi:hypothetical protein
MSSRRRIPDIRSRASQRYAVVAFAAVVLGGAPNATADPVTINNALVLVSTLSEPAQRKYVPFHGPVVAAVSFQTSSVDASLFSVTARLSTSGLDPILAELRIDQDNGPGPLLTDLGTVTPRFGEAFVQFPVRGAVTVNALSKYWLVLGTPGHASWLVAEPDSVLSYAGWTVGPWTHSTDGGASWLERRSDVHLQFQVNGTPVPEPASVTLISLGLAAMGVRRWRRKQQTAPA